MPKRKRDVADEGDRPSNNDAHLSARRKRASEKIHHGKTLLHRALKLAKGFERQKLSRRQKTAKQKGEDAELKRIEDEIEALKNLDLVLAAESHLHKTLNKEKAIATSPALPAEVTAPSRAFGDKASMNVAARLYNANPVKEALAEVMPAIRAALGVKVDSGKAKTQSKKDSRALPAMTSKPEESDMQGVEGDTSEEDEGDMSIDGEGAPRDVTGDVDDDFAAFDARVAGSSDEEDEDGEDEEQDTRPFRERTYSPSVDGGFEDSDGDAYPVNDEDEDEDIEALTAQQNSRRPSPPVPAKPSKKAKPPDKADTTFLPSLTMGGYWSGSESEAEDIADIDIAPRKNRRGQRARQQIWEKKYGKGAKHLQQDAAGSKRGKTARDDGWDAKKGARDARQAKSAPYRPAWAKARDERHAGSAAQGSGGNATALGKRKAQAVSDKPLHPSWEAAKKAKEAKKMDIAAFAGKKMTFD